jgi:AraC-like DNA-binding protein
MSYLPPEGIPARVEAMTFARLRELDRGESQRGDFLVAALVRSGRGEVALDFRSVLLEPHSIVWIGSGVVHQWVDITHLDGDLVIFPPTAPVAPSARVLTTMPGIGAAWGAVADEWELLDQAMLHLGAEFHKTLEAPTSPPEILGSLLSALILRASPEDQLVAAANTVFQEFRAAVEADLGNRHDVEYYARLLSYSPRTLSRAAYRGTGKSAKSYLAERVVLEAQRLLVHEGCSLKEVSQRLGFGDPSAFSAFFRRETGLTPGSWRNLYV